ncbi:MAG: hypothetical protein Q8N22_02380 [bacterium]|nr:hypothetical protein [bacterium]
MNYLLIKIYAAVFGINKVLAQTRSGGTTPSGNQGGGFTIPNPLGVESISQIINSIAYSLSVYIAPPIVTIMILFAAFKILTAGDNPENIKSAQQMILWTCVGYGIILISWGITSIIQQLLGG